MVAEAAQPYFDAGLVVGQHPGIGNQHDIGGQLCLVVFHEDAQVLGAYFLFAFHHDFNVAGHAAPAHHHLQGLHVHVHLAFVVAGAAGVNLVVLDNRLEGRQVPQRVGVGGLHVVVAVDEHRGQGRVDQLLAVDDGVAGGLAQLYFVEPYFFEALLQVVGGPQHVALELGVGGDGGNAKPVEQLIEEALLVFFEVGSRHKGGVIGE